MGDNNSHRPQLRHKNDKNPAFKKPPVPRFSHCHEKSPNSGDNAAHIRTIGKGPNLIVTSVFRSAGSADQSQLESWETEIRWI